MTLLEGDELLTPLGASATKGRPRPSFRLISASKQRLNESSLRKDLAQRLGGGDFIRVPGLSERREDIPALVERFLSELREAQQVDAVIAPDALACLMEQPWPGQVRELRATVRATALRAWGARAPGAGGGRVIVVVEDMERYLRERVEVFGDAVSGAAVASGGIRKRPMDLTVEDVRQALAQARNNRTHAADALGISPTTLRRRMAELGLVSSFS